MVSLAPKSQVFSDQILHSTHITHEMRNAQCHLHDEHSLRVAVLEQVNQLRAHEQVCGEAKMAVSPPWHGVGNYSSLRMNMQHKWLHGVYFRIPA
jgi:hypothetical protein